MSWIKTKSIIVLSLKHMSSLGLNQLIKEVTRPASKSCLDNVYTNRPQHIEMTKVLNSGMSNHLPVCLVRKYQKHRSIQKCKKTIRYRRWKHFNAEVFRNDLEKAQAYSETLSRRNFRRLKAT